VPPAGLRARCVCGDTQGSRVRGAQVEGWSGLWPVPRFIPIHRTVGAIATGGGTSPVSRKAVPATPPRPACGLLSRTCGAPTPAVPAVVPSPKGRGQCVGIPSGKPCPCVALDPVLPRACPAAVDRGGYRHWGRGPGRGKPPPREGRFAVTPSPCRRVPVSPSPKIPTPPGLLEQCVAIPGGNRAMGVCE